MQLTRPIPLILVLLTFNPATLATAEVTPIQPSADLVEQLQQTGPILYFRHALTEADDTDQLTADPTLCGTQRVLSGGGWHQVRGLWAGIATLDIRMGDMIASQYCRAWQSADLAFGHDRKDAALNFEKSGDDTPEPITAMRERVLPNLATPIAAGTNLVVVGNGDPFETVTGIYPEPQGVAFVLRQTDTGVGVRGSIATDARPDP